MPRQAQYEVRWDAIEATYRASDTSQPVTDSTWGTWLARHRSFAFQGYHGRINLRSEPRHGGENCYWYAYRRQGKHVGKQYAGRSPQLTLTRLEELTRLMCEALPLATSAHTTEPTLPHAPKRVSSLPLLAAKLQPPRLRAGLVSRDRLLARLDAGYEGALTLIAAPAGFGKTTLVNQWVTSRYEADTFSHFAWLALDASDADPARLWRYFIAACQRLHPAVGAEALALLHAATLPPFEQPSPEAVLTYLLNDLVHTHCQGVLVLEDYHFITAPPIHDALVFFIEHLPVGLRLIVMTRRDPPFPLARWRAQGIITEITPADLSFTPDETAAFFHITSTLTPDAEALAQIESRLEGWAAGLRMLALAWRGDPQPDQIHAWLSDPNGRRWIFSDYFVAEVLEIQPEEIQQFLLMTSGLQRLSAELCDAVLERTGSAALLDTLERAGLFLEPLEQHGNWYRFHTLFAEAMQREAERRLDDAHITEAARRASAWYEAHEMLPEAIEAALHVRDFPHVALLIERYVGPELFILGMNDFSSIQEFYTLHEWLEKLPEALVQRRPALSLTFAATKLMSMAVQRSAYEAFESIGRLLHDAEDGWRRLGDTARLGEVFAFRALIARERGAIREAITWADQALAWLPAEASAWRGVAVSMQGIGAWYSERLEASRTLIIEARALSATLGNRAYVRANTNMLAYITLEMGELHRAEQQFRTVLVEARADNDPDDIGRISSALAQLLYEWNDLGAAWAANSESLEMSRLIADEETQSYGVIMRARLRQARGEMSLALQELATMEEQLVPLITPLRVRLVREIRAQQAMLHFAQEDFTAVHTWWVGRDPQPDDIPRHNIAQEEAVYARLLLAQGHVAEAVTRITALRDEAQRVGRMQFLLQMQILLTQAYLSQRDQIGSRQIMRDALLQAQPEGYIRLFIDSGTMIEQCIRDLIPDLRDSPLRRYASDLLRAFAQERGDTQPAVDPDALSPQELRVLRLLVAGQTNPDIAQELVVSVNTVKAHIKNLYRKLGVSSRVAATHAARQQHLL
jgi:LuxR family maltose regulon positive regulatory protein